MATFFLVDYYGGGGRLFSLIGFNLKTGIPKFGMPSE